MEREKQMAILLLVLAIIAIVVGLVISIKSKFDYVGIPLSVAGCFTAVIMVALIFCLISNIIDGEYIDKKISMYQEENAKIEEQIDALVQDYMRYESDTFSEFKSKNSMALVSLYPELKVDELVQNQISIYSENSEKIKELKELKIDVAKSKWWLYFGE